MTRAAIGLASAWAFRLFRKLFKTSPLDRFSL
jgi:hypothetical protein